MCLEDRHKTLLVDSPLKIPISTPTERGDFYPLTSASRVPERSAPPASHVTAGAGYRTCAWAHCQPGTPLVYLPVSNRVSSTPTTTSANAAEVAYSSGVSNMRALPKEREILVSVGVELALVAGVMVLL